LVLIFDWNIVHGDFFIVGSAHSVVVEGNVAGVLVEGYAAGDIVELSVGGILNGRCSSRV